MADNNEYKIPIGIDIQNLLKDVQSVKSSFAALNKEGARLGRNVSTQFQQAAANSGNLSKNIVQNARNFQQAATEADRLTGSMRGLSGEISNVNKNASNSNLDNLNGRMRDTNNTGAGFLGTLGKIGATLGIVFGVQQILNFGKELLDIGRKAGGVERAFNKLGDSETNIERLRNAVKGTVGDLQLMQLAVRADFFKIPLDVLAKGLAFAQQRAVATGQSVDYLVNSFVDGIGRKSTLVLDNLGISANELQQEVQRVGDFTEAVGNIIEKSMGDSGEAVDEFGMKVARLEAMWENAKLAASKFTVSLITEITSIVTSDTWAEFWNRISNYGNGDMITRAKDMASSFKEISKYLPDRVIGEQELIPRFQAGTMDFEKELAEARRYYSKMKTLRTEYELRVKNGTMTEKDQTIDNYREIEKRTERYFNTLLKIGKENPLLRSGGGVKITMDTSSVDELKKKLEELTKTRDSSKSISEINNINKQIDAVEKNIDKLSGKREKADKTAERAENKALQRAKQVSAERVRIENDTLQAQVDLIEDKVTKAVAKETTESQSRIRLLENRKKDFPELVKEINGLIEAEEKGSAARVTAIIQRGQEEDLKATRASQAEIRKVMRSDSQNQIDEIEARYELIIENAKKAGTLTADIESSLAIQKEKDIARVSLEERKNTLDKQEQLALNSIYQRKKRENESEAAFERRNQIEILKIYVEFAEKRLELIKNDPAKIAEINDLTQGISNAKKELDGLGKEEQKDIFSFLGIDGDSVKRIGDQISKAGEIASDVFDALGSAAEAKGDKIREEIDAIDELMSKQEEAVEKERDLLERGFANNYENEQKELEAMKQQKEQLLKEEEKANKKAEALQKAKIIADSAAQASNLITSATNIYSVFSPIPVVGIPLAIAMIGVMMGSFVASKAAAMKNTKLAEGGEIGGRSHADGGNKFVSVDGNTMIEHERGEFVVKKTSYNKHKALIKAINSDDFSKISASDESLRLLLEGTGVMQHKEVAKEAGLNNLLIVNAAKDRKVEENKTLLEISDTLKMFFKHSKDKPEIHDAGDYVEIKKGNKTQKIWKK